MRHSWPGNVRELRNYLERCVFFGNPPPLDGESETDSPSAIDVGQPLKVERSRWIERFERRYLEQLLLESDNNVSTAARQAGVDRAHLYRLLSKDSGEKLPVLIGFR